MAVYDSGASREALPAAAKYIRGIVLATALFTLLMIAPMMVKAEIQRFPNWTPAGNLAYPAAEALTLNDGRVFVPPSAFTLRTMGPQLWNPRTNLWSALPPSFSRRLESASVVLNDGRVIVTGGQSSMNTAELYNPATNSWKKSAGLMAIGRYLHRATKLADGRVLLTGGCIRSGCAQGTTVAEIYDPRLDRFIAAGSMNVLRTLHTATLLKNGKVLITGGYTNTGTGVSDVAELFDPGTRAFSITGNMGVTRAEHTATLLSDGRVLVTGGGTDFGALLRTAEIYNPALRTWTPTGDMPFVRLQHSAALLNNGKVLICGGQSIMGRRSVVLPNCETYDRANGMFAPTTSMLSPRLGFGFALLVGGRVLAVGGDDALIGHQYYPGDAEAYKF